MTKRKAVERRLIVVSKRRQPTDEGLARLVAAMVLHRLDQIEVRDNPSTDTSEEDGA
jgi:hypothetical protein